MWLAMEKKFSIKKSMNKLFNIIPDQKRRCRKGWIWYRISNWNLSGSLFQLLSSWARRKLNRGEFRFGEHIIFWHVKAESAWCWEYIAGRLDVCILWCDTVEPFASPEIQVFKLFMFIKCVKMSTISTSNYQTCNLYGRVNACKITIHNFHSVIRQR